MLVDIRSTGLIGKEVAVYFMQAYNIRDSTVSRVKLSRTFVRIPNATPTACSTIAKRGFDGRTCVIHIRQFKEYMRQLLPSFELQSCFHQHS